MSVNERANRLVVVLLTVSPACYEDADLFAASFADLGLTSFGETSSQALRRLKTLYRDYIHALRTHAVLAETLDRLGVKWHWHDEYEYPQHGPRVEYTNDISPWAPPVAANNQLSLAA